jgi:hypothetical protein
VATRSWVRSSKKARSAASLCVGEGVHRCVHGCSFLPAPNDLAWVRGGIWHVRHPQTLRIFHQLRLPAAPPMFVEDPVVRDLEHPRAEPAQRRIECAGIAPHRKEDFLDDLLGGGAIKRLSSQAENPWCVAMVQGLERLLPTAAELIHQVLVRGILVRCDRQGCRHLTVSDGNNARYSQNEREAKQICLVCLGMGAHAFVLLEERSSPWERVMTWGDDPVIRGDMGMDRPEASVGPQRIARRGLTPSIRTGGKQACI